MTPTATITRISVRGIGGTALQALSRSGGRVEPIDGFVKSPYRQAGKEVVWLGARPRVLHPRMIVVSEPPPPGIAFGVEVPDDLIPWMPESLPQIDLASFRQRVAALAAAAHAIDAPRGFGHLLVGRTPPFPLDLGLSRLRGLESALRENDPVAIDSIARSLLGFGTGLTPSGDDLVGGLLFARHLIGRDADWMALSARLTQTVHERTHAISAALFADLAQGASYAWLHDLVAALATDAPRPALLATARTLVSVGHSSGWDMLVGFVLGVTGRLTFSPSIAP